MRAIPRERTSIGHDDRATKPLTQPLLLTEDPDWVGPNLQELLAGSGLSFDVGTGDRPFAVAVVPVSDSQHLPSVQRLCASSTTSTLVVCCGTSEVAQAVQGWQNERVTAVESGQFSALGLIVRLAQQNQRLRGQSGGQDSLPLLTQELRSPLNGILGFARLVLNTQLSPTQREYLEGIFASGESLMNRLTDISELVRLANPTTTSASSRAPQPAECWSLSRRPGLPGPPLRILVADDNAVSQALAVLVLEEQGHEVALAGDGEAVLARLAEQSFDLILMDVQMPKLDGYLTTRAIREKERDSQRHLPIIAVTAHGREGDAEVCLAAGMDGFVAKPIHEDELFDVMQQVLGWRDELPAEPGQKMLNREGLQRRLGGREDQLYRVVRQFLEMLPRQMDEVYHSFSRGDHEGLSASLHRLKCSALAFDAPRILDPISRLEGAARRPLGLAESGSVLAHLRAELEQLTRELVELVELETSLTTTEANLPLATTSNWPGLDRPLRTLVAEDNPINQTLLLTLLEEHSCDITLVENGQAAVDACAATPFDVILMDIQMPILDGLEAMALIHQREASLGMHTPIVVMTASSRERDGSEYLAAGASHYLCKPIQEDDLLEVLQEVVDNHGAAASLPCEEQQLVDVAALGDRLQYKLERLARLTQVFNQVLPGHLADLKQAVVNGAGKDLEVSAHRFKTTLRTIEARSSLALAQQLEAMGREGRMEGTRDILDNLSQESEQIRERLDQLMAEAAILAQL